MFKNATQKIIAAIVGVIVLLFTLSVIIATMLYQYITNTGGIILNSTSKATAQTTTQNAMTTTPNAEQPKELLKFRGIIQSDPDHAKDLDLGDSWYWLIIDEPYLLENNASGVPKYVDKLQVSPIKGGMNITNKTLDDFSGIHVEVAGHMGWGYAESVVIEPIAITALE